MPDSSAPWTIQRLLEWTASFFLRKGIDSPRLSAELLLAHVLSVPRIKLYTNYQRVVSPKDLAAYRRLVARAAEDEPIAHLTGRAHFFNLEFEVTRDVLIPRPDTETLVENVIQLVRHQSGLESPRVLDLCTGSGCIAAAIAFHVRGAVVVATELKPAAVAVAQRNVQRLDLSQRVLVQQGHLFDAIPAVDRQPFDLIVANPPYIPTAQIPALDRSVRDYEPVEALDGGLDGLSMHRRILSQAPQWLVVGGHIFLEIAFDQGPLALEIAAEHPRLAEARILADHAGRDRVLTAKRIS